MYCGDTVIVKEAIQAAAIGNVRNWSKIARTAMESGNYGEAYDFFTRILEVDGENSEAWIGKAEAAGRMSTIQNCRLPEMVTGVKTAVDCAAQNDREKLMVRAARFVAAIASEHYQSMKSQLVPYFHDENSWHEYLRQCWIVLNTLESAHQLLTRDKEIISQILIICNDSLKCNSYRNPSNGRISFRSLPANYDQDFQSRKLRYELLLSELDPTAKISKDSLWVRLSSSTRNVGVLLGLGIFFLPWYFCWFTLRKGHSALARLVSFGWLSVIVLSWIAVSPTTEPGKNYAAPDVTASPAPTSTASRKSSASTPEPSEAKPFETESQREIFAASFIKPVLKGMLNDPDSLDDLSITSVNPINRNPGAYKITVSYRAKNGFGAVTAQQQQFVVTKGTGSGLEGLWNVTPVN
jgi:hypothetical protein